MNSIDGSNRHVKTDVAPPPSLLAIVLDTNPHAWAHLSSSLSLSAALANILVFINAHLASGNANEVAVIASHSHKATFLYPTPTPAQPQVYNGSNGDIDMNGAEDKGPQIAENPNKYRAFALVESAILKNFTKLLEETEEKHLAATPTTLIGGAISLALTYISKSTMLHAPTAASAESMSLAALADAENSHIDRIPLTSRILIVSVSGDLANQYIPVMNSIFAAQRKKIPIDILKLAGDTVLLQQASDATGGVYMKPERPEGLLQYLMMAFLPDGTARNSLVIPSAGGVDFRAACFCHRQVVDIGFVCSVCLSSTFHSFLERDPLLTCHSILQLQPTR
jgi:transcription initiation factor TFIIH subunit 3